MNSGVAISFEGISNAGKSTAVREVARRLRDRRLPVHIKQDLLNYQDESIGGQIRKILSAAEPTFRLGVPVTETLLMAAKRAYESQTHLEPAIGSGAIVLCDRDVDSWCAYQLPVLLSARPFVDSEVCIRWMRETNRFAAIEPELTLYLKVSIDQSLFREETKLGRPLSSAERDAIVRHLTPVVSSYEDVFRIPLSRRKLVTIETDSRSLGDVLGDVHHNVFEWLEAHHLL